MSNQNFLKTFGDKDTVLRYGIENLYKDFLNVVEGIDDKYIVKTRGVSKGLCSLFGLNSNDEVTEKLNGKSISEFRKYIKIIAENIVESLNNSDSFISQCLVTHGYVYGTSYRDLKIEFNCSRWENHQSLEFSVMSMQKNSGCGSGESFHFDLVDSHKLNQLIEEVNQMDIPQSVKNMYIDYFNYESGDNLSIEMARNSTIEGIIEWVNDYIYQIEDDLKNYSSLKNQGLKEKIIKYVEENSFTSSIADAIIVDYTMCKATSFDVLVDNVTCKEGEYYQNENKVTINFLGNEIKTISKTSHTVYEIK